jgi:hypothetical protein
MFAGVCTCMLGRVCVCVCVHESSMFPGTCWGRKGLTRGLREGNRYLLLLQDMLKRTSRLHPDYPGLTAAVEV